MSSSENLVNFDDEDINIKPLLKSFLRNKLFIILVTTLSSLYSIYYSGTIKPTYKGSFEILVKNSNSSISASKQLSIESLLSSAGQGSAGKTQELILKSPSVLKPIYNYVLDRYSKKGIDTTDLTYLSWLENDIEIKFKENSQILSVTYFNNDKTLINDALNKISEKYQDFSKSDREKELNRTIKYLETQEKIYKERAIKALKKLNKFSIDNGLGDIDGFVTLSENNEASINNGTKKAGQRFQSQFQLLENYESLYTDYSSKLKPNSKTLKTLKLKIENLRESLKRPNQILLEYRELANNSKLQDKLSSSLSEQLLALKLEQARQLDPWQLISEPTLEKKKIAPNRSFIVGTYFIFTLIISSLFAWIFEKYKGNLYELKAIQRNISCKYLYSLFINNVKLSSAILEKNLINYINQKNSKNGLIFLNNVEENLLNNLVIDSRVKILKDFDFSDRDLINTFDNLFLVIESGKINLKETIYINQFINLHDEKFKGWFFIE